MELADGFGDGGLILGFAFLPACLLALAGWLYVYVSSGWLYVAHGRARGFPLHLAEAMAAGLPCVAIDSPMHRSLLRHGDTGLLCSDGEDMLRQVARLVDDRDLRAAMGRAARREAEQRFVQARFRDELLAAYDVERQLPA